MGKSTTADWRSLKQDAFAWSPRRHLLIRSRVSEHGSNNSILMLVYLVEVGGVVSTLVRSVP